MLVAAGKFLCVYMSATQYWQLEMHIETTQSVTSVVDVQFSLLCSGMTCLHFTHPAVMDLHLIYRVGKIEECIASTIIYCP